MGRRIRTRLGILHPDLSIRMSEKTKLGNHTARRNFIPEDPGMVRDYRDRDRGSKESFKIAKGLLPMKLWWAICFGNGT